MKEILTNNTPEKWEEIKTHPFYKEELSALIEEGEKYLSSPIPSLPLSLFRRFMRDGNRSEYEKPYFERRRRIARLAILCRLYGDKYKDALEDLLWAVLEESTWALPAHLLELYTEEHDRKTFLALFSTETGALLSLVYHILGEKISAFVRTRIESMVRARIIEPFFAEHFWWMEGPNNWGAVCGSQVALCVMILGTEAEFRRAEPSFNRTMNLFLATYGKDGCCLEGLGYWKYGFGSFLDYADAVRNYSEGRQAFSHTEKALALDQRELAHDHERGVIDYFKREDVKRAALFAQNVRLTGDVAVSFSDGFENYRITRSHLYLLKREYPDLISYPDKDFFVQSASSGSLGIIRHFLWSDPEAEYGAAMKTETLYYEEGQWFIHKSARYSLAAKGGHNDEAHNHNDIGSFLITSKEGSILCDLGSGEYTRQYFEPETRYDYLVNSSRGHSVPIIGGELQKTGTTRAVAEKLDDDTFTVHYGFAYEVPILKDAVRTFSCDDGGVTITDVFSFTETPTGLVERFVSRKKPSFAAGCVSVDNAVLSYDEDLLSVSFGEEQYSDHACVMQTAYFIDFTPKTLEKDLAFTFRIEVSD